MARVNQHHVARYLGISQITVSRALRGGPVSEETRERVLAACSELGYHVNYTAQSLVSGKTRNIVYGVEDFTDLSGDSTHSQLIGAGQDAQANGYRLSIDLIDRIPELAASGYMDGALVALYFPDRHPQFLQWLRHTDFPVVLVNSPVKEPGIANVRLDDQQAAWELTHYLMELGHRSFVFFGLVEKSRTCVDRYNGFLQAVKETTGTSHQVVNIDSWIGRSKEVLGLDHCITRLKPWPTAWVASSDACATGLLSLLGSIGINVPGDVSVVGFGNSRWSECLAPPLTTVDLQGRLIGKTAMEVLFRLLQGSRRRNLRWVQAVMKRRDSCTVPHN